MRARDLVMAVVAALPSMSVLAAPAVRADAFDALAARCAPSVHPETLRKLATTESTGNPFAVSNWDGRQPRTREEALQVIDAMLARGTVFAVGVAQIHRDNVRKYGHTFQEILDPCANVRVGAEILAECFGRAPGDDVQLRLRQALSCYYSGGFTRGFQPDRPGGTSYVQRVVASAGDVPRFVIPAIEAHPSDAAPPPPAVPSRPAPRPVAAPERAPGPAAAPAPWVVIVGSPQTPLQPQEPPRQPPVQVQAAPAAPVQFQAPPAQQPFVQVIQ